MSLPAPRADANLGSNRLGGKTALVTGAGQGIGEAIARAFIREGGNVVLADVQDQPGGSLATELGPAAWFVRTDVTSTLEWSRLVAATTSHFGSLDILVNNAGTAATARPLADEDEELHRRILNLNLTGYWAGMRAVVPEMAARGGGSIVNISSIDGLVGVAGMATYTASKFAVTGLTRTLALEVGDQGIRVNSVHPGFVGTPLVLDSGQAMLARLDAATQRQPIRRLGRPEEIANAVLFFASDESSYCTGSSLVVDGGHLAGPHREPLTAQP